MSEPLTAAGTPQNEIDHRYNLLEHSVSKNTMSLP